MDEQPQARLTATVTGTVQGVGFRYYTRERARGLALTGIASNEADGSVLIIAEGADRAVRALAQWLTSAAAPGRVDDVDASYGKPTGEFRDFRTG
ncbi:acylphosphatase [Arthrobacter sp. CAN_A1]|uniref:acylphosphatase n=1 Tax=Arthrobacter sp. CAN_A1 TaxID=2787717 RepID=UPI0018CB9F90